MGRHFQRVILVLLCAYPALGLVVEGASSALPLATGFIGLVWMVATRRERGLVGYERDEKLLFFAFVAFVAVAAIAALAGGLFPRTISNMERYARLLLVIPLYLLVRRAAPSPGLVWVMIVCGAILAGAVGIWHAATGRGDLGGVLHVRGGVGHHIHFGAGAVMLAFLSMVSVGWFRRRSPMLVLVPLSAALLALIASVVSGSRGSWAAIPPLVMVAAFMPGSVIAARLKAAVAGGVIVLSATAYLIPQTGVAGRVDRAVRDVKEFVEQDRRGTSVGARMEMWRAAGMIFRERPLLASGVGSFSPKVNEMVEVDLVSRSIGHYDHPHNTYLNVLATRGGVGFLALVLLFGVPARIFWGAWRRRDADLEALGAAGMVIVTAYLAFGLSDAMFERTFSIGWYTYFVAMLSAMVMAASKREALVPASRRHSLSVTIIARDEADRIGDAISSVRGWADDVLVLDSGSTDDTVEIARGLADRVEVTDWPGYGAQKQRAAEAALHDWVLSLDADERLTQGLRAEIDQVLSEDVPLHGAYRLPLAVVAFGGRIDFGRSGYAPIRLFHRGRASFSDARVHEVVEPKGSVGILESRLLHLSHRDLRHAVEKLNGYAWLKAEERAARGSRGGVIWGLARGLFEFFYCYVFRLGFLDGRRGLLASALQAQYVFNSQAAIWDLRRARKIALRGERREPGAAALEVCMPLSEELRELLVCPKCKGELHYPAAEQEIHCLKCRMAFSIEQGVPVMLIEEARKLEEAG